jgi:uncharacterized protein (TIGR00730 family)
MRTRQEADFTGGGIHATSPHRGTTGDKKIDAMVDDLLAAWDVGTSTPLIAELLTTALKIGRDGFDTPELKLINRSLKEIRAAELVFAPFEDVPKIAMYGSARTAPGTPEFVAAQSFAQLMRQRGYMGITGAGDGIMGAAQAGSGRDFSFGLNIDLPFEQDANETIRGDDKLISFNYFFTRKLFFVKEAHAIALFPGGFGTMDEGFEVLTLIQTGKARIVPIVMVDAPGGTYWKAFSQFLREQLLRLKLISDHDFHLFKITDNIVEAADEVTRFYSTFHSYRYVRDRLVLRLKKELPPGATKELDKGFPDLLLSGSFEPSKPLRQEANEPHLADLPRIVFRHHSGRFGRLRQLIDAINTLGA